MHFVFKLLAVSFLFVLVAALYWPTIEKEISQLISPSVENSSSDKSSVVGKFNPIPPRPAVKKTVTQENNSTGQAKIYKWVDGSGNVVFSDTPGHEDAVVHTPDELAQLSVSEDIKQRIAVDKMRSAKQQTTRTATTINTKTTTLPNKGSSAEYTFSNTGAGQKHKYILLSGRISDGATCKQLRVNAEAVSDEGSSVRGTDTVSYNGFGSTLFEMELSSSWNGGTRRPHWEISSLSAKCVSK